MEDFECLAGFENTEMVFFHPRGLSCLYNVMFLEEFFLSK